MGRTDSAALREAYFMAEHAALFVPPVLRSAGRQSRVFFVTIAEESEEVFVK